VIVIDSLRELCSTACLAATQLKETHMKYSIAVRSYSRANQILKKTLGELNKQLDLDLANQLILGVVEEQYEEYKTVLKDYPIKDIIKVDRGGFQATNGLVDYFQDGDKVIFMDDDISGIKGYKDIMNKDSRYEMFRLGDYFTYAFDKFGEIPFGFDFTPNLMFKQGKPFAELKMRKIGGAWWGSVIDKSILKTAQSHEDDNIRTARALAKHGRVGSINWMVAATAVGTNTGGMQSSGDRSADEDRKYKTQAACYSALANKEVARYYQPEPVWIESMEFYSLRLKNIRDLRRENPGVAELKWSTYFQVAPDATDSLEDLFG
jgi:hypothetical protein